MWSQYLLCWRFRPVLSLNTIQKGKEFITIWVFTQNLGLKLLTFQITSKWKGHFATLKLTKTQKADFSIVGNKQVIVQNKPIAFLHGKLRNTVIEPRTLFHFTTWQSKHHLSLLAQSVTKTRQALGERFEERQRFFNIVHIHLISFYLCVR